MFNIINAAITPGTHPAKHNKLTMTMLPQPLSITASGGSIIDNITLNNDIFYVLIELTNIYILFDFSSFNV